VSFDVAPESAYLPALQERLPEQVSDDRPTELPYVPGGHLRHPPLKPVFEAIQRSSEYRPRPQGVHPVALMVPSLMILPSYPGAHTLQDKTDVLPLSNFSKI
jgi:hypothetical protein